jgi:hypothetical protein
MKATYKEFSKYLRAVANLYAKYGDAPLEVEKEYNKLHDALCQMHKAFRPRGCTYRGTERYIRSSVRGLRARLVRP